MWEYNHTDELYHFGVKGMKWGHRKAKPQAITDAKARKQSAKQAYKQARKDFNKSYNSADSHRLSAFSLSKSRRQRQDERWDKAFEDGKKLNAAKKEYKKAKKAYKDTKEKVHREGLNKYYKDDINYAADKYTYGKKGVERISKRMNKGMSSFSAHTIEAGRLMATTTLTTFGTFAAIGAAASIASKYR